MKNILLFTGTDFIAHIFLNKFVPSIIEKGYRPIIITVDSEQQSNNSHPEMERYRFYENKLLNKFIFPYLEKNDACKFNFLSIPQIIKKYNLKHYETSKVNDQDTLEFIENNSYIGGISIRCFQIFKSKIISQIKSKGFFCNSHPGLLPDYRGVYCMLRGLVNGDQKIGWTLHNIDTGIDTGSVIEEISIKNNNKSYIHCMSDTINYVVNGWSDFISNYCPNATYKKQKNIGNYYSYPTNDEMDFWLSNGLLQPLKAKEMVKYYFDLFIAPENRLKIQSQDFKVFLINKIAQFETLNELDNKQYKNIQIPQKTQAA